MKRHIQSILAVTALGSIQAAPTICSDSSSNDCDFVVLHEQFARMLRLDEHNNTPSSIELLLENEWPIFHEGPVLLGNSLYFTSNRHSSDKSSPVPKDLEQCIDIYQLDLDTNELSVVESGIKMANGMTLAADGRSILALSQGYNYTGAKIYNLDPITMETTVVLETYDNDTPFNSMNDISTSDDGILFFTDPQYGFQQGFRQGNPELCNNVYRYDSNTGEVTKVSNRFQRPNGIALQDTRKTNGHCTLYITETGDEPDSANKHNGVYRMKDPAPGGCFEASHGPFEVQPIQLASTGAQDGIMVHDESQTLLYCDGRGAWVWSLQSMKPIGIVPLEQGCTQLVARQLAGINTLYLLAETKLYSIDLDFASAVSATKEQQPSAHSTKSEL